MLGRIFNIENDKFDLPVAFATNAMYILVRNGLAGPVTSQLFEDKLLPIIIKKQDWLHAEGICQAVHALSESQYYNEEIWNILKQ